MGEIAPFDFAQGGRIYETNFGDVTLDTPVAEVLRQQLSGKMVLVVETDPPDVGAGREPRAGRLLGVLMPFDLL